MLDLAGQLFFVLSIMLHSWSRAAVNTNGGLAPPRLPAASLATRQPRPWRRLPGRLATVPQGLGNEAVGTWLDLASFVSASGSGGRSPYDELADKIGRDVYMDVAGWHLFLKDVRVGGSFSLAQGLAQQLGPQIDGTGFKGADLQALLKKVPIKLGQGRVTVALLDLLPAGCIRDLEDICEDYARRR